MELKNISKYTSNNVQTFLNSPSGKFLRNGVVISAAELQTKQELLDKVANGELATTTDPKYVVRGLKYTGDETSPTKAPNNIVNHDHIVLEQLPANADLNAYKAIIEDSFKNVDYYYNQYDKPQLYLGEREVDIRVDTDTSGKHHIHLLVNRHAVVSKEKLQDKLTELDPKTDKDHIEAINKALGFLNKSGKDKALEQTCDFNNHYVQFAIMNDINAKLATQGLAPIPNWGSYSQNSNSNVKTTAESKNLAADLETGDYTPEAADKVLEKIAAETTSSLDGVVIQKRLNENQRRAQELSEELRKLTAESRQLNDAQKAIVQNSQLVEVVRVQKEENEGLKAERQKLESQLKEKFEEVEQLEYSIEDLKTDKAANADIINGLREELNLKVQEIDQLAENVQSLESKIDEQDTYLKSTAATIDSLTKDKDDLTKENKALTAEKFAWIEDRSKLVSEKVALENNFKHTITQLTQAEKDASDKAHMASIKAQEEEIKRREVETTNARLQEELHTLRKTSQDTAAELHKAAQELERKNGQLKTITSAYEAQKQEISDINHIVDYINEQLTKAASFIRKISTGLTSAPAKAQAKQIVKGYDEYRAEIVADKTLSTQAKIAAVAELQKKYNKTPAEAKKDEPGTTNRPKPKN